MRRAAVVLLVTCAAALPSRAAEGQALGPGDARFDQVLTRLLSHGQRRIPNRPSCPTPRAGDTAARSVTVAEALAGAIRREGEGAGALQLRLRCHPAGGSRRVDECRLLVSAVDGGDESSAGLSFETPRDSAAVVWPSVRCVLTP